MCDKGSKPCRDREPCAPCHEGECRAPCAEDCACPISELLKCPEMKKVYEKELVKCYARHKALACAARKHMGKCKSMCPQMACPMLRCMCKNFAPMYGMGARGMGGPWGCHIRGMWPGMGYGMQGCGMPPFPMGAGMCQFGPGYCQPCCKSSYGKYCHKGSHACPPCPEGKPESEDEPLD
eukprot:gnl/Chilomastix_cuspidata/2790.p2 GENE.gnl/Chilomastix_cuspidata/2790~~gnl/Chilomastix_cuspidata/2790.p2  ORF type:complete len:192 (-),score=19.89 gnl/Chilomastix_cuspidata/2790:195-734(-)